MTAAEISEILMYVGGLAFSLMLACLMVVLFARRYEIRYRAVKAAIILFLIVLVTLVVGMCIHSPL